MQITQELLHNTFQYNEDTGLLTWLERDESHPCVKNKKASIIFNARFAGTSAGAISNGYLITSLANKRPKVHRLVFLYCNGYLPKFVDHINGNRSDNRISNLREATQTQNSQNMRMRGSNKSGVKGVSWHKAGRKWEAGLQFNGKKIHLGLFSDIDDAELAVKAKRLELHGEFACNG